MDDQREPRRASAARRVLGRVGGALARVILPHETETGVLRMGPRPEFRGFDLLATAPHSAALRNRELRALDYVVFDTETTGLKPSQGDRLVQIGAVHIAGGALSPDRTFDRLANPGRPIPPLSTRIHGITDEMVADAPTAPEVVADFHRFADGAILVAHNAAFDLMFLSMAQDSAGVTFTQPVLDTLFLARALDDRARRRRMKHDLDSLLERFGIEMDDRHSGLADAMATARLFLTLIGELAADGIHTLGQALTETHMALRIREMGAHF